MEKSNYWPELKKEVDNILLYTPLVKSGKMFGYPAYYVNNKLAICHYHEGLAMKLPEDWISCLQNNRSIVSEPFCPMGKSMGKKWVIVFLEEAQEIRKMEDILLASIQFLNEETNKK